MLAVFLLAVEAIKLENLSKAQRKGIIPFYRIINPRMKIVDEFPPDISFYGKHEFAIRTIAMYLTGLFWTGLLLHALGVLSLQAILPGSFIGWIAVVIGVIIVPMLLSLIVYTIAVGIFFMPIKILLWIQKNTQNGIVGIMGFTIYLIQYVCRRVIS